MTSEQARKLFPNLATAGYDGSPEARARRQEVRRKLDEAMWAEYWDGRVQGILDATVPPENRLDRFEKFDSEGDPSRAEILEACMCFATGHNGGALVLIGGCGRGKTLLAVSIAREYLEAHQQDRSRDGEMAYVTEQSLLERYDRARSYKSLESTDDVVRRFSEVGMLIVDELGKWSPSRDGLAVLEQIVDHRIGLKPTVFLSNLSVKEFQSRYTSGFISRISECVYALPGKDHRGEARQSC